MNQSKHLALAVVLVFLLSMIVLVNDDPVESIEIKMRTDLSNVDASFWGEDGGDNSGRPVAGAGDVNGDGYDDILIGASLDDDGGSGAGQTYLILGKASGWAMDTDLSSADASFWGEDAGDESGSSIAGAGDVNGDGYDDILIGAYGDDDGGSDAGQTYLILGKASGWSMDTDLSSADASYWGEDAGDRTGERVSGAGDVNGDGYEDILIGAYGDDDGGYLAGQTYLILGKASGLCLDTILSDADASFLGEDDYDYSGYSISGAGDVNGDGYDDIIIGAFGDDEVGTSAGQTYIFLGKTSGWSMDTYLANADASFLGENAVDRSGERVSGAGDVNGDGCDDILIGAPSNSDGGGGAGQTYLIFNIYPPAPKGLESHLSNGGYSIELSWKPVYSNKWSISCYTIYRSETGYHFSVYDHVEGDTLTYTDENVEFGKIYYYAVTVTKAGYESSLSDPIRVVCQKDTDRDGIGDLIDEDDDGDGIPDDYDMDPKLVDKESWTWDGYNLSISPSSFIGEDSGDEAGYSISCAGDVNGDGYDDIVIGACHHDYFDGVTTFNSIGKTYLIFGRGPDLSYDTDLSNANASFRGENENDYSGISVSGAGDVNGDGYDDILIGADQRDEGGTDAGQTYLILGRATGWVRNSSLSTADASFIGEDSDDRSGRSVSSAGDVNGDGYDDILIGAYGDEDGGGDGAGQTYLIFGKSSGWSMDTDLSTANASFIGEDAYDRSGIIVSGSGDVNGDGYDDILIGAHTESDGGTGAGQTYLIFGRESGWAMDRDLSTASASFLGEDAYDYSGYSVSGAGDVNGDGYDDILIGAHEDEEGGTEAGQTYLIFGKSSGWSMDTDLSYADASFWGEDGGDYSGISVSGAGDVNNDGYDDILIGAYRGELGGGYSGQAYLILGKSNGWRMDVNLSESDQSFWGERVGDYCGRCVSTAGDVNGDGYGDIIIGSHKNDEGGADAGQTYLIYGKSYIVENVSAKVEEGSYSINLSWDKGVGSPYLYGIYRGNDPRSMYRVNTTEHNWYHDYDVVEGITYVYAIDTVCPLGGDSPLSFSEPVQCSFSLNERIQDLHDDINSMNDTITSLLEEIWNIVDYSNMTQLSTLQDLWNIADYMNDTIWTKLDWIEDYTGRNWNHLSHINSTLNTKLDWLVNTIWNVDNNLTDLDSEISLNLSDLMDLTIENYNQMNYMNNTFRTYLAQIMMMESILLDRVDILISDLRGVNNSLNQSLLQLSAQITAHNDALQSFREDLEVNITSMLVLLNGIRDNMSAMDQSSLNEIKDNLTAILDIASDTNMDIDYVNGTVTTDLATIIDLVSGNANDLTYMNTSLDTIISDISQVRTDISDLDTSIGGDLSLIITELDSHRDEFQSFETTYTTDVATLIALLNGLDVDLDNLDEQSDAYFLDTMLMLSMMDLNITSLDTSLSDLDSRITSTMLEIISDMDGFNDTMRGRIDMLELELEADILSLMVLVEGMNTSLNHELTMLDTEMSSFKADTLSGLEDLSTAIETLSTDLEGTETDLMDELNGINAMIDNIETTSLPELRMKLDLLALQLGTNDTEIMGLISDLQGVIDTYDAAVTARLENITQVLEALDELEQISADIEEVDSDLETLQTLEQSLSNVESEQSGASSSIGLVMILLIIALVLLLGVLGIGVFQLITKKKGEKEKAENW